MPASTYSVFESKDGTEFTDSGISRSSKASAIKLAEDLRNTAGVAVQVQTSAGNVVFEMKAPGSRVIRNKTPQFTRVETVDGFKAPKGYTVAYFRKRAGLAVCRPDTKGSPYLVINVATGTKVEVSGTKEACQVTTRIGRELREAKATASA